MAHDILAIPITTVASKFAFSARTRVIDKYCAKLAAKIVQVPFYEGDWCKKIVQREDKANYKYFSC